MPNLFFFPLSCHLIVFLFMFFLLLVFCFSLGFWMFKVSVFWPVVQCSCPDSLCWSQAACSSPRHTSRMLGPTHAWRATPGASTRHLPTLSCGVSVQGQDGRGPSCLFPNPRAWFAPKWYKNIICERQCLCGKKKIIIIIYYGLVTTALTGNKMGHAVGLHKMLRLQTAWWACEVKNAND